MEITHWPQDVFDLAVSLAGKSTMRQKVSAIIYTNNGIIGQGYNHWIGTVPSCIHGVPVRSIHAEIMAIRWAYRKHGPQSLSGSTIYVYRKGNRLAKPCDVCMSVIEMFGMKVVWSPC